MDVKLMTLVAALMVALYAPPSQGMQRCPSLWIVAYSLVNFDQIEGTLLQGILRFCKICSKYFIFYKDTKLDTIQ